MDNWQQSPSWILIRALILGCFLVLPNVGWATDFVVIGGTEPQNRMVSCIAEASTGALRGITNSEEPMIVVILEHQKFLQARAAFHAYRTVLAFSNLGIRRIYLSSHAFTDSDTALRVIAHELGHFVMQDAFEGHAEIAAERIRWRARQTCWSGIQ